MARHRNKFSSSSSCHGSTPWCKREESIFPKDGVNTMNSHLVTLKLVRWLWQTSLQQQGVDRFNGRQSTVSWRMQSMVAGSTTNMISEYSNPTSSYSLMNQQWKANNSFLKWLEFHRAAILEILLEWSIRCQIKIPQPSLDYPQTLIEVFRDSTVAQSSVSWSSWQLWAQVNSDLT